ncbi:MAG TPA: helix-turn-helix domain-containing protein [Candidatus Saccharimonadales bacterium]|nr:helix-turn-helix domain-containing protein [Candidatus Saccharimonadales bacterium]
MNDELISQIEELGLSNKEARVYTANLMLGPAGVQQIADASGIKRVTTYVILESLVNLGLVSQTSKTKKTLFNAESPENLRRLLEKREQSVQDQKHQLEELLPQLDSLKTLPKDAPGVKFYDSGEGIRTVMKTFIAEARQKGINKIYGMSNIEQLYEFFPEIEAADANPDRLAAGIASQYIYTSKKGPIFKELDLDAKRNRNSRFVPYDKYPLKGDMTIVGDSIAMLSLSGARPMGVVIESKELSQAMRTLFELAWDAAEKFNK